MSRIKKTILVILWLTLLIYGMMIYVIKSEVKASERTEDLTQLVRYPEIYTAVQELKTAHPNWTFTLLYTGLNWNDVLYHETEVHTRSVVAKSLVTGNIEDWICQTYRQQDGTPIIFEYQWYCASNKTTSYYLDPRNWLNETYIFAFETLSFNENVHTIQGVQSIIAGTFMDKASVTYIDTANNTQVINKSYAQIIYEAGKQNNVSPYHLAARIIQEQGRSGTSGVISGNYKGYIGYYNYFNIGSTGEGDILENGLKRAKDEGWTNPELAICNGAAFLSNGYINNLQDTLYLQKFNVDKQTYWHQYQQNLSAPYTENLEIYAAYENLGILNSNFNFIIPIYENMPSIASEKPGGGITLQTENVLVTTQTVPLSIRTGPSTNFSIKAKAPTGTTLLRIEKAQELSSDARYWDRVVYNTGTETIIGYASREYLQDIATVEIVNEVKTVNTMCNLRNGPTTTNTKVKQILQVGTEVTVIDKINYQIDAHTWYRVKLADGTQGYVSSAYLQGEPVIIEKYKIEENYIKISPGTVLTDIPGAILNSEILATGANITIGEQQYTLVVMGDVSGDGNITPSDYVKIKNNIMGTTVLEGANKTSADVNRDGNITPADYVKVKNHIMNISKILL